MTAEGRRDEYGIRVLTEFFVGKRVVESNLGVSAR